MLVIRVIFHENNECYPQVFLDEFLYKFKKFLIMVELKFLEELILIKQVHQNREIFVTVGV